MVKTIKFRENPRPDEMVKQIGLVIDNFKEIFNNNKNLTIRLERKKWLLDFVSVKYINKRHSPNISNLITKQYNKYSHKGQQINDFLRMKYEWLFQICTYFYEEMLIM